MSTNKSLDRARSLDNFEFYNEETGEYIETKILHVEKPEDLKNPVLDGIERTMNLNISRAPGWHYADGSMLFIPAYRKVKGQSLIFGLSYLNKTGNTLSEGISFTFSNAKQFKKVIPIIQVFEVAFNISDPDTIRSMIGVESPLLGSKYMKPIARDKLNMSISANNGKDITDLTTKLRIMVTTQTKFDKKERLYDVLSLKHFIGLSLAEDLKVGSMYLAKHTVLSKEYAFLIEHSGLPEVKLLTPTNEIINVTLIPSMYAKVKPGEVNVDDIEDFLDNESEASDSNIFEVQGKQFLTKGAPNNNTLEVYCAIINRLLNFEKAGINFSMQDYKNQQILDFAETLEEFRRSDLDTVYNNIENTKSLIEAVNTSKLGFINTGRATDLIKHDDSSIAVISKNENPIARTANGNVLVRNVEHLSREAVKVMPQDLGMTDPVDTAESKNIGKTTPLTMTSDFDSETGSMYTKLYKVVNCYVTNQVEEVPVKDIPRLFIAEHGADLSSNVLARHNGEVKLFLPSLITHTRVSPFATTSVCRATSAFLENTDQKRTQMTANTQKQARTVLRPKRALVETGVESIAANGQTGIKHIFTAQDIFNKSEAVRDGQDYDIGPGPFQIELMSHKGMEKEYRITSISNLAKAAVFKVSMEKSSYGSSYYYELVPPSDGTQYYKPYDVVYKQHNIMFGGNVKGTDRLNYHTNGDENFFNQTVANGLDLFVMFGFCGSYTVDDASVISDRIVRDMSLATPVLVTKTAKKFKAYGKKNTIDERRGVVKGIMPKEFNEDGLPYIGTYLRPGATWLYRYRHNSETNTDSIRNMHLEHEEHGEVIDVKDEGEDIRITIAKWVNVKVGDKFSGRHGNKTIIAKVLPAELMPYDPLTGRHVDMIINPLGIPSRGNISQLAELQATANAKAQNLDTVVIPPFSNELQKMVEEYEEGKVNTEVQFINPKTGMYYPEKHFCGYMHYLRNYKIAEDQLHAIGDSSEIDLAYRQPVGGSGLHEKGQSISSMEKEILVSYGASGILNEIHGILSADREKFQVTAEVMYDNESNTIDDAGTNIQSESIHHAMVAFHSTFVQEDEDYIRADYLNDKGMEDFTKIDLNQLEYSLTSRTLLNNVMYIPLSGKYISPVAINKFSVTSIIGVYKIEDGAGTLENNLTEDSIDGMIRKKTRSLGPALAEDLINGNSSVVITEEVPGVPKIYYFKNNVDIKLLQSAGIVNMPRLQGMEALIEIMERYPMETWVDIWKKDLEEHLNSSMKTYYNPDIPRVIAKYEKYSELGGFEHFITTRFPVLPNKYRPGTAEQPLKDAMTKRYEGLCRTVHDLSSFYASSKQMMLPDPGSSDKSIFEFFAKKDLGGRIRGKILKTRVLCSLRSTIVPMFSGDPKQYGYPSFAGHPDSIGLPLVGALRIAQPRVIAWMNKHHPNVISDFRTDIERITHIISILTLPLDEVAVLTGYAQQDVPDLVNTLRKGLTNHINGNYVFYGRAPSLHETSLRGGKVYVHDELVIHLHSLLTTDLNADHDGDQIYVVMPLTNESVEDIKKYLLPSKKALRYNDGQPSLLISQDPLLGLYFATAYPTSDAVRPVKSIEEIKYNLELGLIKYNDLVTLPLATGKIIKTTAGRLIFNEIAGDVTGIGSERLVPIEGEENIYTVPYDVQIAGKSSEGVRSIADIQLEICTLFDDYYAVEVYRQIQDLGYEAVERRNLTVGIKDLTPSLEVASINKEIKLHVENARTLEEMGMLPDDYIVDLDKKLNDLINKLNIMDLVPEDNAFKILAVSGAKGKEAGIKKMFGVQGFIADNAGGKLATPLLSNTVRGLSQFQVEELSYTQRDNAISTVFETSKPGETLRSGAFELAGLIIEENQDPDNMQHLVLYEPRIIKLTDSEGNKLADAESTVVRIGTDLTNAHEVTKADLEGLTIKGVPLTMEIIKTLTSARKPKISIDNSSLFLFPDVVMAPLAEVFLQNKFDLNNKFVDGRSLRKMMKDLPEYVPLKTHINEFSLEYGISQFHAGTRSGEKFPNALKSNIGIKASTATAQPANQLVISKRNLERAGGNLDNGIDMFKDAIQNAKYHSNDRNAIELLAPEDGVLEVVYVAEGVKFLLKGESGNTYEQIITVEQELNFKFLVGTQPVFLGQTVAYPSTRTVGERLVHPTLSFAWKTTTIKGFQYGSVKEEVVNPSTDLIQLARYYVMIYLETIYRDNGIKLDFNHYGAFALQTIRHGYTIYADENNESVKDVGYINLYHYVKDVVGRQHNALVKLEATSGADTIMLTAGAIAAIVYRDAISAISRAVVRGSLREYGGISKLALGVDLREPISSVDLSLNQKARKIREAKRVENEVVDERFVFSEPDEVDEPKSEVSFDLSALFGTPSNTTPQETVVAVEKPVHTEIQVDVGALFGSFESTSSEEADVNKSAIFGGGKDGSKGTGE